MLVQQAGKLLEKSDERIRAFEAYRRQLGYENVLHWPCLAKHERLNRDQARMSGPAPAWLPSGLAPRSR